MRRGWIHLITLALATGAIAGPAASAVASDNGPTPLEFVTVTFTLSGKKSGKLVLRLTRGTRLYAKGTIARAKPGKNVVKLDALRTLYAGKYTFRWTFTPTSGAASSGKSIVTVKGAASG